MATILTKRSNTASSVPVAGDLTNSADGAELAVNTADRRLFTKNSGGSVVELGNNPSSLTLPNGTNNGVAYLNGSKVLTTGSALTFKETGNETTLNINSISGTSSYKAGITVNWDENAFILYGGSGYKLIETVGYATPSALKFYASNSEQMRLTSTGLGIGTSSPSANLQIQRSVPSFSMAETTSGTLHRLEMSVSSAGVFNQNLNWNSGLSSRAFTWSQGGTENMRLNADGNLGLGVTPSAWRSTYKAIELGRVGNYVGGLTSGAMEVGFNAYVDSGNAYRYANNGAASTYYQTSGAHQWYTAPSGTAGNAITFTQAMTLDASGRLGIGETSLTETFTAKATAASAYINSTGQGTSSLFLAGTSGSASLTQFGGELRFNTGGSANTPGTSVAERARIDSSGNLLVGKTADVLANTGILLDARGSATFTRDGAPVSYFNRLTSNGDALVFLRSTTQVGSISVTTTATAYNTSSDYRLKEDIQPMTGALAKVAALKPCTYKWKADGSDGEGFIAHELQEVVPQCVTGEKDAVDAEGKPVYQGIDTSFLVATLTAAIQELKAEFDAYKATHP